VGLSCPLRREVHGLLAVEAGVFKHDSLAVPEVLDRVPGRGTEGPVGVIDRGLQEFVEALRMGREIGELLAAGAALMGEDRHLAAGVGQFRERLEVGQ